MDGLVCDRCGGTLLLDSDVRYRARIEVFAAYDPLEISSSELGRDLEGEMQSLIHQMEKMDPEVLQDQVHRQFEFDLCPPCQRLFLRDPLGRNAGRIEGDEPRPPLPQDEAGGEEPRP